MQKITMIIGEPAVGKSTIMRRLMTKYDWKFDNTVKYVPIHWRRHTMAAAPTCAILGRYDDVSHEFPGTDRMSMACQPHVIDFIMQNPEVNFLFEGDRLGNDKMIKQLQHVGCDFRVLLVAASAPVHRGRYRASQRNTFRASRHTKISNMVGPRGRLARTNQLDRLVAMRNDSYEDMDRIVNWLATERVP